MAHNCYISSQNEVSVDTSGTTLALEQNNNRRYFLIYNGSNQSIFLRYGSIFPNGFDGLLIQPGQVYESVYCPVDAVYLQSASGTQSILVIEGSYALVTE